jgi:hypothetical protein
MIDFWLFANAFRQQPADACPDGDNVPNASDARAIHQKFLSASAASPIGLGKDLR